MYYRERLFIVVLFLIEDKFACWPSHVERNGWRKIGESGRRDGRILEGGAQGHEIARQHPSLFQRQRLIGHYYLRTHYDPLLIKHRLRQEEE